MLGLISKIILLNIFILKKLLFKKNSYFFKMNYLQVKQFLDKEYSEGYTRGVAIDYMFDMILKRLGELNIKIFNVKDLYRDFLIFILINSNYK